MKVIKFLFFEVSLIIIVYIISFLECMSPFGNMVHKTHNYPDFVIEWGWRKSGTEFDRSQCPLSALTSVCLLYWPFIWLFIHIAVFIIFNLTRRKLEKQRGLKNLLWILLALFVGLIIFYFFQEFIMGLGSQLFILHISMYTLIPISAILFLTIS